MGGRSSNSSQVLRSQVSRNGAQQTPESLAASLMARWRNSNLNDRVAISELRDARNEFTASEAGIAKTLRAAATEQGAFNAGFNDEDTRERLQRILGDDYEFRRVDRGRRVVPGFTFMGMPVRGNIGEWRLFRRRK